MSTATRTLPQIIAELQKIQTEYKGKPMPQPVGEQFEALATEAKALQDERDREAEIKRLEQYAAQAPNTILPGSMTGTPAAEERKAAAGSDDEIVGYIPLGRAFTESDEFKTFLERGAPKIDGGARYDVDEIVRGQKGAFIPVSRKTRGELQAKGRESKAVASLANLVIPADRIADVVRATERTRLTVRDVLNVQQTGSNLVEYLTMTAATVTAAPVADSAQKPEVGFDVGIATAPVRTIADWMPITEQQLMDIPQLRGMIDTELLYQLDLVEEQQVVWGPGTGQNLLGIFNTSGVTAGRTVSGDTIIDQIRRASTDVLAAGLQPNAVLLHPLDYEAVVLTKGTTGQYIYQLLPTADGGYRLWGLTVVESLAMQKPTTAGTVYERRFLVGDFVRGATLWDRMQSTVAVGWINDQFIRNQRTVRAERREAFGVKRPLAFKYRITQAES